MTWKSRGRSIFFLLVLAGGFFAMNGKAQILFGTISGTVRDPSGAVIPNARISIKNSATGVTRATTTNARGVYDAPGLSPGPYTVSASATGFKTAVQSHVTLTVGASQVVNYVLQVGEATQTVQVAGAAATVNLISSSLSNTVSQVPIVQLPLNGRDWTQLAQLTAGVVPIPVQNPNGLSTRGPGIQISISGSAPERNDYRLNGISINDSANNAPGSALGEDLGVDSIQEFSVLVGNYSAQYGRASGGIVNAITKAGTNQYHGDAYEFFRNDSLDAANFFDNSGNITKPQFQRNQFGASLGGPIRKGKAFFFVDYEGVRQNLGVTNVSDTLTASARTGALTAADGGPVTVNPSIAKILPLYPLPNGALLSPDVGVFNFPVAQVSTENYLTSRLDDAISNKDSVFGAFVYDKGDVTAPDAFDEVELPTNSENVDVTVQETHIFSPTLINIARGGYVRAAVESGEQFALPNEPLLSDPSLATVPGGTLAGISVAGLYSLTGGTGSGPGPNIFYWNSFQGSDDLALTKGDHSLKFGASFERDQSNMSAPACPDGAWTYNSIADFLSNNAFELAAPLPSDLGNYLGLRDSILGAYAQDDWRARPNLTLSLGMRYEMSTVPHDSFNRDYSLHTLTASTVTQGPLFNNPTYLGFSPRVGIAWDPFHNGKTSVRAGFGIYNDLPLAYYFLTRNINVTPFANNGAILNPGVGSFPTAGYSELTATTLRTQYVQQNPDRPYVYHWDFDVERQLRSNMVLSVAYMGERGIHLIDNQDNINTTIATQTPAGLVFPPVATSTVVNPNFGEIQAAQFQDQTFYDALDVQLNQHLSHGVSFTAAYTWEKAMDYSDSIFSGGEFENSIANPYPLDMFYNYGLADYNIPQRFVFSGTWDVPTPSSFRGPVKAVLGGWEVGSIITAEAGDPFSVELTNDQAETQAAPGASFTPGQRPNVVLGCGPLTTGNPNAYVNTSCFSFPALGTLGDLQRNGLAGPGLAEWDFSLMRNFKISKLGEAGNLQFRAEFFNILNRANFDPPDQTSYSIYNSTGQINAGAGELTTTALAQREIQFALKLMF
ncbi:MAG: carboxypeptidase regulatory-like domain-containing protein [Terriglobia bacterium]